MRMFTLLLILAAACAGADRYTITEDRAAGPDNPKLLVMRDIASGVEAAIAPSEGGELSSFRVRHRGKWVETIHKARDYTPSGEWRGKAPLLWPATGRNVPAGEKPAPEGGNFVYLLQGKRYPMPIHGYVSGMPWKLESRRTNDTCAEILLLLRDTPETRRYYPFGYVLWARYKLSDGKLRISYTVDASAANTARMPFSIGNHITFHIPFTEGTDPVDMLFETPSSVEYLKSGPANEPTGEEKPRSYRDPVPLSKLPVEVPVTVGGYGTRPYMKLTDPDGFALRMTHWADTVPEGPVCRFNIWGNAPGGYFSPEPWIGLQNSLNLKKGLTQLAPGQSWNWTIELAVEQTAGFRDGE